MSISRPLKLTNTQTILYEIDMLNYTARAIAQNKWQHQLDSWVYLEAFLVHFRNLIEFFGDPGAHGDDLSIHRPDSFWGAAGCPADAELAKLAREDLWNKYEARAGTQRISKYLHHCTAQRVNAKDWPVGVMHSELKPTLELFERLIPDRSRSWEAQTCVTISTCLNASTAS